MVPGGGMALGTRSWRELGRGHPEAPIVEFTDTDNLNIQSAPDALLSRRDGRLSGQRVSLLAVVLTALGK